jgi:hypothetical protein
MDKFRCIHDLVVNMARQLSELVPAGILLTANQETIVVTTSTGEEPIVVGVNIRDNVDLGSSLDDSIAESARNALDQLQDIVTRETTWPWPEQRFSGRSSFATAHATVTDGVLYLWYGDAAAPAFPALALAIRPGDRT